MAALVLGAVGASPLAGLTANPDPAVPARVEARLASLLAATPSGTELPVFVHALDAASSDRAVAAAGLRRVETFRRVGVTFALGRPAQIEGLRSAPGVTYLQSDRPIEMSQDTSQRVTRMQLASEQFTAPDGTPLDGSGVGVAIVDSGVRGDHPSFGNRMKVNLKYVCGTPFDSTCYRAGAETQGDTRDEFWQPIEDSDTASAGGHGTHVAGIAAAGASTTADGVKFRGSAPGAEITSLSVGAAISVYGGASALNWVIEHGANPCEVNTSAPTTCAPIKAVNNSYGPDVDGAGNARPFDPNGITAKLQAELVDNGVTVVWAAGNDGGDGSQDRVNPDAKDPRPGIIGVANYDDGETANPDNSLDASSSRGKVADPTTWPDISAPGTNILSTCGPAIAICRGTYLDDPDYGIITGTSMAAPHIAGYVAVLLEANPSLTPGQIEFVLEATAHKFTSGLPYAPDPRHPGATSSADKGHGLVDMARAVARVRGLPEPPVVSTAPVCSPEASATSDPEGDAPVGAGPSNPSLDLRRVELRQVGGQLVGSFLVRDLRADAAPPTPPSVGEVFDLGFTYAGAVYYLRAHRQFPSPGTYRLGKSGGTSGTGDTNVATGTGSFDAAAEVVTIKVPITALPGLTSSAQLSSLTATSRSVEGPLLLTADTAALPCPMSVVTPPPPPCNITVDDLAAFEGDSGSKWMEFIVKDSSSSPNACNNATLEYSFAEGSATSGSDYSSGYGRIEFRDGLPRTRTVYASIHGDTEIEGNETFSLVLEAAPGSNVVFSGSDSTPNSALGTILNDDHAPAGGGQGSPRDPDRPSGASGYRMVAADGGIFTFGDRVFHGSTGDLQLNKPIVGGATDPSDYDGYWIVASDGGVFSFNADFHGSLAGERLPAPAVEIEPTPTGRGYWIVLANGKVRTFGDAGFFGDISGTRLNKPVIGMSVTPSGRGYWLVAEDGGIFNFGDAGFFGSTGDRRLNAPIIDLAPAVDNNGYYLLGKDGGVFTFGSADFKGSTGDMTLNAPVIAMLVIPNGGGYWLAATDGGIFTFGSARFHGSMGGTRLNSPVLDLIN